MVADAAPGLDRTSCSFKVQLHSDVVSGERVTKSKNVDTQTPAY